MPALSTRSARTPRIRIQHYATLILSGLLAHFLWMAPAVCLAAEIRLADGRTTVSSSPAEVAWDCGPGEARVSIGIATGQAHPLTTPEPVERTGTTLRMTYRVKPAAGGEIVVRRDFSLVERGGQVDWVEQFDLTPARPLAVDVEIRRPFTIRPRLRSSQVSVIWPLRNGWARTVALTDKPQSAEFRLADTLTGREATELALPVVDICLPGGVRAAVCADPRFSTLFTLRQAADGAIEGEMRYRYRGGKVPLAGTERRRFGLWLAPSPAGKAAFGQSVDAFFRLMLPDVPPGPPWLHEIAMVGYDYLSDGGQGWSRDVAKLAEWLSPAERRRVALCFHGWYDGLGTYALDESTGRMKDHWVAMPRTRKIAFTKKQVQDQLRKTRELGFRVLWYFGDGLVQDSGAPGYRAEWNLLNDAGKSPRPTWTGPDTFANTFIRNPAIPAVSQWYKKYLAALLADYGPVVDGFVWDETYYIRRGDLGRAPAPGYSDRAMFDLVGDLRRMVKACDREKVFLSSDDVGVFGMDDAVGYAMVADGNYQDSWCVPEAWSYALFPNWRNTSWSCNWWPHTHFARTQWGVETFGVPVAISNGWEDDRGPSEWTPQERDRFLALFRKRLAMSDRLRYLTDDPAKLLATAPGALPPGDTLPESPADGVNWALASRGARARASSEQVSAAGKWPAAGAIDGIRDETNWSQGHGWASLAAVPQSIEVQLARPRDITAFAVITFQAKTGNDTAAVWGVKNYTIDAWDPTAQKWKTIVEENKDRTMKNRVHRLDKPVRVDKFRVVVSKTASADNIARLFQVEAWGPAER